ncbi:MAG: hypothetical protein RLZZ142_2135 [Verrucomicrobiota bacterium]|jgi:uncharacterized RDD family membrane protein YckC
MDWYYAENGAQVGPVSELEIRDFVAQGRLNGTTLVWNQTLSGWEPLAVALPEVQTLAGEGRRVGGVVVADADKDRMVQRLREGAEEGLGTEVRYGGFWLRLMAKILDGVIQQIPMYFINKGIASAWGLNPSAVASLEQGSEVFMVIGVQMSVGLVLGCLYSALLNARFGATLGKKALGLRVVTENGANLSIGRAVARYFAEMLSAFLLFIGFLMVGFDSKKRGLHDRICATFVVRS